MKYLFIVMALVSGQVFAAENKCDAMAKLTYSVAQARDHGISFSRAYSTVTSTIPEMGSMVKEVYKNKDMTPDEIRSVVKQTCEQAVVEKGLVASKEKREMF